MPLVRFLLISAAIGSFSQVALAQRTIQPFTIELSASAGGTFDFPGATAFSGICQPNTTNCHQQLLLGEKSLPVFGGEVAVALNRFLWMYGDYNYMLPDRKSASSTLGESSDNTTVNRHYWSATGGIEVSFPQVHRIVPLLRIGAGEVYHSYNFYDVGVNVTPPVFQRSNAQGIKAGTFAGGVRWYWRERQGVRIMVDGFYLGHGVEEAAPPAFGGGGAAFVTRRSGGAVTVGYFFQIGR